MRFGETITLKVGPTLLPDLRVMLPFVEAHTGEGHRLIVANEGGKQTLACSCGMPGGRLPREQAAGAALVEEDVNDT